MANHGAEDSGCQTLVDMGFDRATAQRVLDESGGDRVCVGGRLAGVRRQTGFLADVLGTLSLYIDLVVCVCVCKYWWRCAG